MTLTASDHVIVVGAGLAGWRFVESLRQEGYVGDLTIVGDEPYAPYDRPPLSKQVLSGRWGIERTTLATTEKLEKSLATVILGRRATRLDVATTSVYLDDGTVLNGTHVVIAIGARARALSYPSSGPLMTLRGYDDSLRLEHVLASLAPGSVVVVIGGGFVGAEVATSLQARGFSPLVLEVADRPLISVVGEEVSAWLERLPSNAGIEVRTRQRIDDVVLSDNGVTVRFEGGENLEASAVVAAVGSALDDEWLEGSGLTLDMGVVVDRHFEAAPHVGAIGDIAKFAFSNAAGEELARIEHWEVAVGHAMQLAHYWMGGEELATLAVPYFWSDQYGKKIQMLGHPRPSDEVTMVVGAPEESKWAALYSRDGLVTGVVALSDPRALSKSKVLLDHATTLERAFELAPWNS